MRAVYTKNQLARLNLWKVIKNPKKGKNEFKKICKEFYFDKTIERINRFHKKTGMVDREDIINGTHAPTLKELLDKIDWDYIADGIPSNFHGDLQFDNILVNCEGTNHLGKFILLDWRQDFGGAIDEGDLYYDLAKFYSSTVLSYPLIKDGMFSFHMNGANANYSFYLKNDLLEAKEEYELFIAENNYDLKKIKTIAALIFLNMSPLFNAPFDLMLYYLGKNMLNKVLNTHRTASNVKLEQKRKVIVKNILESKRSPHLEHNVK